MNIVDASLVVPSFRGAQHLPVLLELLRQQEFAGTWEVVVVLDGVEDDSPVVLEKFSDLPLRSVVFEQNRGRSAALNAGFAEASGRVLIRCDDDLEPGPDFIRRHVEAHDGSSPVGIIGICRHILPSTPYARAYGNRYSTVFWDSALAVADDDRWQYWAGNCSVTRATFDRVGPYDEAFRRYGWEDVDWGYRLRQSDVPIIIVPELEAGHNAANVTTEIRVARAFQSGAARRRFDDKHHIDRPDSEASTVGAKAWNVAVAGLAIGGTRRRFQRLGRLTDRVLDRVPLRVGSKLVALMVESASASGYRTAEDASRHDGDRWDARRTDVTS